MGIQPRINGKTIERVYEEYTNGVFLVNRRYQRKLVWSIDEKESFIDSIQNGYPVPSFLFALNDYKDKRRLEIIDGMQRLNAIFSFIENEVSLNGKYFDLSSTALTKEMLDRNNLKQKTPILDRRSCVDIASYELPFSIYEEENPDIIDEVFRRINANGRHLSRQEIRQAGAVGEFPELVRFLSTQIRGDVSHEDILLLSQMKDISIKQDESGAGIKAEDVFWVKENIIDKKDLRLSMDEEIVADLVGAMVLEKIPPSRVSVLDSYYDISEDKEENRGRKVEEAISIRGRNNICTQFLYIIDEIKKIFFGRQDTIIQHLLKAKTYRGPRYFQILFLSLYDLLIKQEMKISNYNDVYDKLYNISEKTIIISAGGGAWSATEKADLVTKVVAILKPLFEPKNENDPMLYSYATEIENLLRQAKTENSQYDFKQGIYDLKKGKKNNKLVKKIFKTLTSMGNSGKNATGYVLVGVADTIDDARAISSQYNTEFENVGNFYITGIDGEVNQYCDGDYDQYFAYFKECLKTMKINEHYKRLIGNKMRMVSYHDKSIIILKIISDNGPIAFEDNYYTRSGANIDPEPVSIDEIPNFCAKFN